jgi:hypothetical protein
MEMSSGGLETRRDDRVEVEAEGVRPGSPAGYFVGGATGGAGIPAGGAAGAPGIAGMPAGGAGIDWAGTPVPLFMMLREAPLPEK